MAKAVWDSVAYAKTFKEEGQAPYIIFLKQEWKLQTDYKVSGQERWKQGSEICKSVEG